RHTRSTRDWSSDVCSSDLFALLQEDQVAVGTGEQKPEAAVAVVEKFQTALGAAGFFQLKAHLVALGAESAVQRSTGEVGFAMPIAHAHAAAAERAGGRANLIEDVLDGR